MGAALRRGLRGLDDLRANNAGEPKPAAGPNPLIGLRKGTGCGLPNGDQRVAYMQQQLNGVVDTSAGDVLPLNGMWDDQTDRYVKELQHSVKEPPSDQISQPFGTALDQGLYGLARLRDLRTHVPPPPGGPAPGAKLGRIVTQGGFTPGPGPAVPSTLESELPKGLELVPAGVLQRETITGEELAAMAKRQVARSTAIQPILKGCIELHALIDGHRVGSGRGCVHHQRRDHRARLGRRPARHLHRSMRRMGRVRARGAHHPIRPQRGPPPRFAVTELSLAGLEASLSDSGDWVTYAGKVFQAMNSFAKLLDWIKRAVAFVLGGPRRLVDAAKQKAFELVGLNPPGYAGFVPGT